MRARFASRLRRPELLILITLLAAMTAFSFPAAAHASAENKTPLILEIKNFPKITIPDYTVRQFPIIIEEPPITVDPRIEPLKNYLLSKQSPLANEAENLLAQEHWPLIIAIAQSESNMCKRQMYNNCWGIGGAWNLRRYASLKDAIVDINQLLANKYVARGADTPKEIVTRYVGSYSHNWVRAANQVLTQLDQLPLEN